MVAPDNKVESSGASSGWLRGKKVLRNPYSSVAALAIITATGSAVWFVVGGWWWLPLCSVVSAVSMVVVWRSVYAGWIERKAIHQRLRSMDEALRETLV
jgi:uncharacterized membrane protein YdjX (TVP38/TMEM64 family)